MLHCVPCRRGRSHGSCCCRWQQRSTLYVLPWLFRWLACWRQQRVPRMLLLLLLHLQRHSGRRRGAAACSWQTWRSC